MDHSITLLLQGVFDITRKEGLEVMKFLDRLSFSLRPKIEMMEKKFMELRFSYPYPTRKSPKNFQKLDK